MKGKNKLYLNQETIRGAIQWWLNEKVLVNPVSVEDVVKQTGPGTIGSPAPFAITVVPVETGAQISDECVVTVEIAGGGNEEL